MGRRGHNSVSPGNDGEDTVVGTIYADGWILLMVAVRDEQTE